MKQGATHVCVQVAAVHAMGDVWAMGGEPVAALALVTLPLASEGVMEEDLVQVLAGAAKVSWWGGEGGVQKGGQRVLVGLWLAR